MTSNDNDEIIEKVLKEILENNIRHNITIREKNMMREAIQKALLLKRQSDEKEFVKMIDDLKIEVNGIPTDRGIDFIKNQVIGFIIPELKQKLQEKI